jgi:hypothetical protein
MNRRPQTLILLLLAAIARAGWAGAPAACSPIDYVAASSSAPRLVIDELAGQTVTTNPALPAQHISVVNACLALFDERTRRPLATATSGDAGRFALMKPGSGDFTLIVKAPAGRSGSLRVALHVSEGATADAAPRGLLLWFDPKGAENGGRAEVLADLALRRELLEMLKTDQAIRMEMIAKGAANVAPELIQRMMAIDARTQVRLVQIVHQHGWPTFDRVGLDGAGAASTMLQHLDFEIQKEFLPLVEAGWHAGEVEGSNYALLVDRIRDHEGLPELYGGGARIVDGSLVSNPIEDEAHVDERRTALGLMPLAQYVQLMNRMYFPKQGATDPAKTP